MQSPPPCLKCGVLKRSKNIYAAYMEIILIGGVTMYAVADNLVYKIGRNWEIYWEKYVLS